MTFNTLTRGAKLPDLNYMMSVGQLRFIQTTHESGECWNPDVLVSRFLSPSQRWRCFWRGGLLLNKLRSDPFYYYVVARTRYYDSVFLDALSAGMQRIVNVGCGSDTRAYRFADLLTREHVSVLECDQDSAISAKQKIARKHLPKAQVEYQAIDLNETAWPQLEGWLARNPASKTLVLMEGVSPYIQASSFDAFLRMLARRLPAGSRVAYDFKILGTSDAFGSSDRTQHPFRLPSGVNEVKAHHEAQGFSVTLVETSTALCKRLLPTLAKQEPSNTFNNDCLVQLEVTAVQ